MVLSKLVERLNFPPEVAARISPVEGFAAEKEGLLYPETFEEAANALHEGLSPDEDGIKILSAMLEAAAMSERRYLEKGIPEEIYFDTMGCFPRFVREYRALYGTWGFHLWGWAGRQTSGTIYRLGSLEYETAGGDFGRELSVHIPSDADLSPAAVDDSLRKARVFFGKYAREYGGAPFTCFSWMLDPALGDLLPPDSRIRMFAARFRLIRTEESRGYLQFVFKKPEGTAFEDLPEETSLQRALKAHLSAGGRFGAAYGVMDP